MASEDEHTIKTAAQLLGTSEGAVRQRIRRGTLRSIRRGGRVYVALDGTEPSSTLSSTPESTRLTSEVAALRDEVEWLRGEVQRKDAILLNMTEAMKALSPPTSEDCPESAETAEEGPEGAEPRSAAGGAQEGAQRPWWRRWFGG